MTNDQFLKRLPDRPIAFHRDFVRLTFVNESGKTEKIGVKGALMLSQAVYWSKRTKDPDGWFWKTQDQWEEETGLTSKEQETLNRKLMLSGLMKIKKEGIPSKNFYQVQTQKLVEAIFSIEDISSDDQKGSLETNNFQSPPKGVTGHPQRGSHSITEITAETTFLPTTPLVNILVVDDTKNADFVPCGPKCASAPQKCLWHNVATYIKTSDLNILLDLDAPYLLWLVEKTRVDDYSIKVIAKKATSGNHLCTTSTTQHSQQAATHP